MTSNNLPHLCLICHLHKILTYWLRFPNFSFNDTTNFLLSIKAKPLGQSFHVDSLDFVVSFTLWSNSFKTNILISSSIFQFSLKLILWRRKFIKSFLWFWMPVLPSLCVLMVYYLVLLINLEIFLLIGIRVCNLKCHDPVRTNRSQYWLFFLYWKGCMQFSNANDLERTYLSEYWHLFSYIKTTFAELSTSICNSLFGELLSFPEPGSNVSIDSDKDSVLSSNEEQESQFVYYLLALTHPIITWQKLSSVSSLGNF